MALAGSLAGLGGAVYNINQVSLRQAITPLALQGRVNGTMRFLVWGTIPVVGLLGGLLGQWLGIRPALTLLASLQAITFLWVAASPVRKLRAAPSFSRGSRQVEPPCGYNEVSWNRRACCTFATWSWIYAGACTW